MTARDVEHLIVQTARKDKLNAGDASWIINGAGFRVSDMFGFGVIDAEAIVHRGIHWETVPPRISNSFLPPVDTL